VSVPQSGARTADRGEIAHAVEVLFDRGTVVELRAFRGRETVSGYYDDPEALAHAAEELDARGHSVYVTLNEADPDLLARAANRVRKVYREPLTSDHDVVRRRWLPLDFDPKRPSGVSATEAEKEAARLRAEGGAWVNGHAFGEPGTPDDGDRDRAAKGTRGSAKSARSVRAPGATARSGPETGRPDGTA
jgi:hypothetical protein